MDMQFSAITQFQNVSALGVHRLDIRLDERFLQLLGAACAQFGPAHSTCPGGLRSISGGRAATCASPEAATTNQSNLTPGGRRRPRASDSLLGLGPPSTSR